MPMPTREESAKYFQSSFDEVIDLLAQWVDNFKYNSTHMFADMNVKQWLRIIMVICTYLLVRPHLVKLGARQQAKQYEREAAEAEANKAEIQPNDLRGGGGGGGAPKKKVGFAVVEGEDEKDDPKAKVRQRKAIKKTLDMEQERRKKEAGAGSNKEVEELLQE